MSARFASRLAWFLAGLCLVMAAATLVLSLLPRPTREVVDLWSDAGDMLVFVAFLAFPFVGATISSRRPGNPIGWICLTAGMLWILLILSEVYAEYGLAVPGSVPFPMTVNALLYAWLWVPAVGLFGIYLTLLFPNGKLPSRRWRPLAWFSGAVILSESVIVFLTPGPLDGVEGTRNPFGLESYPWLEVAGVVVLPLLPLCMVLSAASLILRYRRSRGEERQQIKWIAFAASVMGSAYLLVIGAGAINWLLAPGVPQDLGAQAWWGALLEDVMVLSFVAVPVSIGFAILKYRLYDIDVIINRALVYGSLTVSLVLVYLAGVAAMQTVFRLPSGQEEQPQLAVVASTLVIAALFNPLRRRIQAFVDRRFYRGKYDAAKTLRSFSAKLREGTDLDELGADVVRAVGETVQPRHVSLWIREPGREAGEVPE